MYSILGTTRKGNMKKIFATGLTYEEAKNYLREADWFDTDHLGRMYDLTMKRMK